MRTGFVVVVLGLLLAGTACGERSEPTGPTVRIYPVRVQGAAERPTVLNTAPKRIVPVGAGTRQILRALHVGGRIVEVNDSLVGLPLVAQIRKARPDLIVASGDADPLDLARARSATPAAVYVTPDNSLTDVERALGDIGLLVGRPVQARRLTTRIEQARRRVAARLAGTPRVPTFIDVGGFATVGSGTLLGDIVAEARGKDVAGPSPDQGPFPFKRLVELDPQAYVALSSAGTTLAQLRANPHARKVAAVRAGRFGVVPADLVQPGPRVWKALVAVARILHPDAFR